MFQNFSAERKNNSFFTITYFTVGRRFDARPRIIIHCCVQEPHEFRGQMSKTLRKSLPSVLNLTSVLLCTFQIPISTLNAVGSVIKNARPLVRFTRERIQQYYNNGGQQQPAVSQQQYGYNRPASQYGFNVPTYFGNNNNNNNNRKKQQQRDDPPPEGRIHRHGVSSDY